MGDVDDYLAGLPDGPDRRELQRLHRLVTARVPEVGQTTSYAMACYTYRGRPVAAIVVRARHIAWYPYSGAVIPALADRLGGHSHTDGALRFSADTPLSEEVVGLLLDIRMRQIDDTLG